VSYRDEKQALTEPIEAIIEGIAKYREAYTHRLESNEWRESALRHWNRVLTDLEAQLIELHKIKRETW